MAERHYIAGGYHSEAVRMYSEAGVWDKAYRIAKTYMREAEVKQLYLSQAQQMESAGKWRDAEQYDLPPFCVCVCDAWLHMCRSGAIAFADCI